MNINLNSIKIKWNKKLNVLYKLNVLSIYLSIYIYIYIYIYI